MILKQFIYDDYPREVPRGIIRPKYYKNSDRIPEKYNNDFYDFNKQGILVDCNTLVPVLKNPKEAGTRRYLKISGQSIHDRLNSDNVNNSIEIANLVAIKTHLRKFFETGVSPLEVSGMINCPVTIEFIFITTFEDVLTPNYETDLDNYKQFYEKVYLDTIQEYRYEKTKKFKRAEKVKNPIGFLPNDNINYVRRLEHEILIRDYRQLIINIKEYKEYKL